MRQFIDVTGKTEEEAINRALEQLKLDRDDVSVEILERAKAGFLGLGSCPAKVRVSYGEDEEPAAPAQPKVEKVREDKPKAEKPRAEKKPAEKPQRREEPVKKESAPKTEEAQTVKSPEDLGEEVNDERAQEIRKFLSGLLQQMEVQAEVKVYLPEKGRYKVFLEGQGLGAIIGRRGETLDAIQQLTGYAVNHPKTALINTNLTIDAGKRFQLLTPTGEIAYEGDIRKEKTTLGEFGLIDFTSFNNPGEYQLKVGTSLTPTFRIGERLWEDSQWKVLNFIFCQRCGHPVPGKHASCHADLMSRHDGRSISYSGGWHDAGDLSQQTLQTGDVAFALLEAYNKQRNINPALAARLREEAEWGVEFILKNRYGDGYRASSMGLLIWQDGVFNTLDDISSVRVQNMAFDNFLYAGYEAYASMTLDNDPMLQEYLLRVAEEDFAFAMEKFKKDGFDQFVQPYEHSYNTSKSQYMATISWSASQLYKLTGKPSYADIAAEYIRYTLDCQRTEPLKDQDGTRGFFYRDKSRKSIVHYIHQSREQVYMQAMVMLCETQKEHPDYPKWVNSIQLYGEYLKGMMKYTHPYGMIPSGVYHAEEYKDTTNFYALHLFPPANAKELYTEQIKRGVQLDKEHYMKRFPVWFNIFNGNTAIHLSNGKSAAICGNFLKDKELLDIGLEQLYWTVGKNPFGQSLIYGEGHNYPQLNTFSSGEMTGEMPVGIRTLGNDDVPYWPQTNNACYKEVWVTSAGKWLSLTAEY